MFHHKGTGARGSLLKLGPFLPACRVLADAAEEGSSASEAGPALEGFCTPGSSATEFEAALGELLTLLRGLPGSAAVTPSWEAAAGVEGAEPAGGGAAAESSPDASSLPGPALPSSQRSGSRLSVQAPAFQPSSAIFGAQVGAAAGAANVAAAEFGGLSLSDPTSAAAEAAGYWDSGGSAPDGGWDGCSAAGEQWQGVSATSSSWGDDASYPSSSDPQPSQHRMAARPAGSSPARPQPLQPGSAKGAAFLSVLSQQFPEYSEAVLAELLAQQGGSLEATLEVLCSLESELQGQAALEVGDGERGGCVPQEVGGCALATEQRLGGCMSGWAPSASIF